VELAGRHVVVTGATRGIGESIARAMAGAGARASLVARSRGQLEAVAASIDGAAFPADLADPATVEGLIARVEGERGPVDVLVNNAGLDTTGPLVGASAADLAATYQVNLVSPAELCRRVLPGMIERGRGHLVNVSSLAGVGAFPGMAIYASTKAGLTQFTAGLRADLRGLPIGTTVVELGPVATDMLAGAEAHRPTGDAFDRFRRIQLLVDVDRETVARDVVAAVRHERRHVRHPKRALAFPLLAEAPRRMTELLLSGLGPRA
jgi:short-subunit dehydrogenase